MAECNFGATTASRRTGEDCKKERWVETMNADSSEQLKFVEGGAELLDRIEPSWKQQTALHAEKSLHFA